MTYRFSALTETWLKDNDYDNFDIPGYSLTKINRENKIGGGVCIFTKENLNIKLRNDINVGANDTSIESLFIEVVNEKTKNIIIGTLYRPPNNKFHDFETHLKATLSNINKQNKLCYIMGDFNIDLLKYNQCNFSNQLFNQFSSSGTIACVDHQGNGRKPR